MGISLTLTETATGSYTSACGDVMDVVGLSTRHYIVTRRKDCLSVHVTGNDAAKLASIVERATAHVPPMEGTANALYLVIDVMFITPALKELGFKGVGVIDTLRRPMT